MSPSRIVLAALLALAPGHEIRSDAPLPSGWDRALVAAAPVAVTVEPVEITGGEMTGLSLSGAWVLRGDHPKFGGFSGLVMSSSRLFAISDRGWWLDASPRLQDGALRLANARLAPMHDAEGDRYTKAGGDAEGLTRLRDRLAVSFERDHRLMVLRDSGRMGGTIQPRSFEQLRSNKGLEALASLPGGRLIVLAEGADGDGVPLFLVDPDGEVTESRLPRVSSHSVTGADVGPDGRLYLVLREYSVLFGVSIRVMRYDLGPDGMPLPGSAEVLAALEFASGIDNMEGISLRQDTQGRTQLWLISDDNFSNTQRTLLMRFEVLP